MELYLYPSIRPHGIDTDDFNFFLTRDKGGAT